MQGLTAADAPPAADLQPEVGQVLDRHLLRKHARPVAVAFSGGGDSLALLLAAAAWARGARRNLIVLSVDHRLRPQSRGWTAACGETAARLGLAFRALPWLGVKPSTGLPAAARQARHRLLADAAREAGARVILIGHTADDVLEARRMRQAGGSTPEPRAWSPSPAWPEGRGLFLLRPLLATRRADIRAWLRARGEPWIDDPANDDLSYARPRARRSALPAREPAPALPPAALAEAVTMDVAGGLAIGRAALRDARPETLRRFVSAACLCAAGTDRPPAPERAAALAARLQGGEPFVATLAGARVEAGPEQVSFHREVGEARRGGVLPLRLAPGSAAVWDGRYEIASEREAEIGPLVGLSRQLSAADRAALRRLPAAARGSLPALREASGVVCPVLSPCAGLTVRPLARERLLAACGAVRREPD